MDYQQFRFSAVVDFIQFEIRTSKPTNFQSVMRHGELRRVVACDAGEGGAASVFRFELHDPPSWATVKQKLDSIQDRFGFSAAPAITAIEVSFDAYSKGATRSDMVELVAGFVQRGALVSNNIRFGGRFKGDVQALTQPDRTRRMIDEGRVINIGNAADDKSQRAYFKTSDNRVPLPESEQRARFEISLRGEALPVRTVDSLETFDFTALAPYFKFRVVRPDLDPLTRLATARAPMLGERRQRNRKGGGTRLYARTTKADTALNRRAYDALRALSVRMQLTTKRPRNSYR